MIYMEPHQLGWTPLRDSYMDTLPENLSDEHRTLVRKTQCVHEQVFYWFNDDLCVCFCVVDYGSV